MKAFRTLLESVPLTAPGFRRAFKEPVEIAGAARTYRIVSDNGSIDRDISAGTTGYRIHNLRVEVYYPLEAEDLAHTDLETTARWIEAPANIKDTPIRAVFLTAHTLDTVSGRLVMSLSVRVRVRAS